MELYLLRHGSSERVRDGEPDSERSLTVAGEYEIRRVIAAARLARACPSLILSSPYKRARQSARIAAELLDYQGPVPASEALTPEADPRAVWEEVRLQKSESGLLLAGHEPLFSACTAHLLGFLDLQVDFPKAGLVRIDFERFGPEPRGILKWMLTPHLFV
jgi:phosphohistidine phosphatase